jgi:thiol:disulfide interchange protein DsbD
MTGYLLEVNRSTAAGLARGTRHTLALLGLIASVLYGAQSLGWHAGIPSISQQHATVAASGEPVDVHAQFTLVRDLGELAAQVEQATMQGKTVMVDLYADWCVACKEFEKYTFPAPAVQAALANTVWLQIDLTDNTPTNLAFQEEFDITGLPTILFFDQQGNELTRSRVTGFLNAEQFAAHVNQLFDDIN